MKDTFKNRLKQISPFHILMWLFAVWGIFHCTQEIIHIFDRLLELDSFNKAGSVWLLGSKETGDFHWRQYKLDIIERVFLNFSLIAIAAAIVTLLMICLFRSEKAAIIWSVAAPAVLIVFTATQGKLFDGVDHIDLSKCMPMAIFCQIVICKAVTALSFHDLIGFVNKKVYAVLLLIGTVFLSYGVVECVGSLFIHRSESMGWIYANVFTALTAICASHIKKQPKQIKE